MNILIIPIFLILMYVALLRPQKQRVRRQQELLASIGVGDEVVTAGGLIGRVVGLTDERMQLEVADGVVIELLRLAISRRLEHAAGGFEGVDDEAGPVPDQKDGFGYEGHESTGPGEPQVHLPPDPDSH